MLRSSILILLVCVGLCGCGEDPEAPSLDPEALAPGALDPSERSGHRGDTNGGGPLTADVPEGVDDPLADPTGTADAPEDADPPADAPDPEKIAVSIIAVLKTFLEEVGRLVRDDLPAGEFKAAFDEHRERAIVDLVELGRHRERLPEDVRTEVETRVSKRLGPALSGLHRPLATAIERFKDSDPAFVEKIAGDIPGLTRYATFEILKRDLPEEAKRLGIE